MDELFELIDSRIKKNDSSLRSVPCKVISIDENDLVEVELISNKAKYSVHNYSGSHVEVGETVQLFYKGIIENNTAYIGVSYYKDYNIKNITMDSKKDFMGQSDTCSILSQLEFIAYYDTNISVIMNCSLTGIENKVVEFTMLVDGVEQTYKPMINTTNLYSHMNFSLPISLLKGKHTVSINVLGICEINRAFAYVSGQHIDKQTDITYEDTVEDDYICLTEDNVTDVVLYTGGSKVPKIPNTLNGQPVNVLYASAFNMSDIEAVYIPDGVIEIE